MSELTKAEKKRLNARAASSAGVGSPSVASSSSRKRSVDSVMKRKASLDSIVSKRMRSKNGSTSKLSMSHNSPSKSASTTGLNSPRGALWDDETERPTPKKPHFQIHVYAGECPGAHAAFFDAQALAEGEDFGKITLLPRTTKMFLKNPKKKKNKGRNRKKEADLDDLSIVTKDDSGDSSTSETRTAETAEAADTRSAPLTPTGDAPPQGLNAVDSYDYVLMVLPHSASLSHPRSTSLCVSAPSHRAQPNPLGADVAARHSSNQHLRANQITANFAMDVTSCERVAVQL